MALEGVGATSQPAGAQLAAGAQQSQESPEKQMIESFGKLLMGMEQQQLNEISSDAQSGS